MTGSTGYEALFWPTANFTLFVVLFVYLYRLKVKPLLISRSREIREHIERSSREIVEAEELLSELHQKRTCLEKEKEDIQLHFAEDARRISEDITTKAKHAAKEIKDVGSQIEREVVVAEKLIRAEVIEEAMKRVRDRLDQGVASELDKRIRAQALKCMEGEEQHG